MDGRQAELPLDGIGPKCKSNIPLTKPTAIAASQKRPNVGHSPKTGLKEKFTKKASFEDFIQSVWENL
jgi:hypothetical protein